MTDEVIDGADGGETTNIAGDTGTNLEAADWRETAGVSGDARFDKFNSPADLAKSYGELESFRGNSVRIPSEDAGVEAMKEFDEKIGQVKGVVRLPEEGDTDGWNNYYQRMGRPAEAKGYEFAKVDGFNERPEDAAAFAGIAHEAGLSRDQAGSVHKWLAENIATADAEHNKVNNENMAQFRADMGQTFDHTMAQAKVGANMLSSKLPNVKDYMDRVNPNGVFDTALVTILAEVARLGGETGAVPLTPRTTITKEEAMLQVQEIRDNPTHPYNDDLNPAHMDAQLKVAKLYEVAYPGKH